MQNNIRHTAMDEYWELVVQRKDKIGTDTWKWEPKDKDKAYLIFEAYRNTIKNKSSKVNVENDSFIETDYGTVSLTYKNDKLNKNNEYFRVDGFIFCPYVSNLF